jgi:hypothetical protein
LASLTPDTLARAFVGQVARIQVTLRFRLGLLLVALATLLLPLIYLALVGLVGLLVYLHLVYDVSLLKGEHVGVYHLRRWQSRSRSPPRDSRSRPPKVDSRRGGSSCCGAAAPGRCDNAKARARPTLPVF